MAGVFNLTRFLTERKGLRSHEKDFEECGDIVRKFVWINLPLSGRQLTWTNKRNSPSFAKVDRFSINAEWD